MEDWNLIAADCIVISCCCQCLVLQIIIFILVKLPCKLVKKTKEYARKKLWNRKRKKMALPSLEGRFQGEILAIHEGCIRIQVKESHGVHGSGSCIEEVERVLEEFSQQGEFAFGSFWGRKRSGSSSSTSAVDKQSINSSIAQLELVEIATPAVVKADQQLKQLRDIFMRFDMDSDGSLTLLELAALLRSLGLKPSGDQLTALLDNMDANGNGYVEFDELVSVILPDMNEEVLINQEQLLQVFQSFDRDGNGFITAAELAGSMAKMGHPLTYRELSDMMREADTNGDGVISFHEFANIMAKSACDFLGIKV
ncbi:hypothetical protein Tsubulata_014387, partial [Turnera subulata]